MISKVATACVQTLEGKVKGVDTKCAKVVDETPHTGKDLFSRTSSLQASLNAERDSIANNVRDKDVPVDCPGKAETTRRRLQKRDQALSEARKESIAAFSKLESLRCTARDLEEKLVVARANIAVQSLMRKESLE